MYIRRMRKMLSGPLMVFLMRTSEDLGMCISTLGKHKLRFLDSGVRHPHPLQLIGRRRDVCILVLTRFQVERMECPRLGRCRGDPRQRRFGLYLSFLSELYVQMGLSNYCRQGKRKCSADLFRSGEASSLRGSKESAGAPRRILRGHPCKPCRTGLYVGSQR